MGFIPAALTAQVVCQYTQDNIPCENVYWVKGVAAWTHALLLELANNVADWATTVLLPHQATNVSLTNVIATDWSTQFGPQAQTTNALPVAGSETGEALPNNVTIAVKHLTDLRGRNYRGRTFYIGIVDSWREDNQIASGAIAAMIADFNELPAAVTSVNSGELSVVSFRFENAPRMAAVVTPITSFSIDPNLDSQRRRLPGHNRHR